MADKENPFDKVVQRAMRRIMHPESDPHDDDPASAIHALRKSAAETAKALHGATRDSSVARGTGESVRQTLDRVVDESRAANQSETTQASAPLRDEFQEKIESTIRKYIPELVAFFTLEGIAYPFCHAGAEAMLNGHLVQGVIGYLVGVTSGVAGITFHWWKKWFSREFLERKIFPWWPAVLLLAFVYVVGPEIYRRAIDPPPPSTGFSQQQVDEKISSAVANLNSQLIEANRQREAARREAEAFRQQIQNAPAPSRELDTPRVFTKLTLDQIRAIYEGRTPLQSDILFADEAGKWLANEGKVETVTSSWLILHDVNDSNKLFQCAFDTTWRTKLSVLRPNDVVKVVGKLAPSQTSNVIILHSCEFGG